MMTISPVEIIPTEEGHYPAFWEILKDWKSFWADKGRIRTFEQFRTWYRQTARDSLTALENGAVVGGAYLDNLYPGHYATVNLFKRRGYLNPRAVAAVIQEGLPYWFDKYDLDKLIGITRHRAARRLAIRLGFRKDGVLRHWSKVDGVFKDYILLSLLRSEIHARKNPFRFCKLSYWS